MWLISSTCQMADCSWGMLCMTMDLINQEQRQGC